MIAHTTGRKARLASALLLASAWGALGCGGGGAAAPSPQPQPVTREVSPPAPTPVASPAPAPEPTPSAPAPAPAPAPTAAKPTDPTRERASQLREAADLLDKAEAAREREAKSFAEQLFSSAELIVGAEALAIIAPRFREGAPPRVTTPTKAVAADTPAQPVVEGDSEKDRPDPKPKKGSVTGTFLVDGKPVAGEFGVVTLTPVGKKGARGFPTARIIEQRGRKFAPHVLVVPVGSVVSFPNFDPTFHNVFSTSETKPFDLGLYKSGETREVLFDREGTVRLGCNLHANMSAFIVVVSAPHYIITDGSGKFAFKSVEPGKYVLRAYNERSTQPMVQEITIKPGRNDIAVGVTGDAPLGPLPDKFGVPRQAKK